MFKANGIILNMSPADRAKQFMPFAALSGYETAIREKEKIIVPRPELHDDRKEEIDEILHKLISGEMVKVTVYYREDCEVIIGVVTKIDRENRKLKIVNREIDFDELVDISYDLSKT